MGGRGFRSPVTSRDEQPPFGGPKEDPCVLRGGGGNRCLLYIRCLSVFGVHWCLCCWKMLEVVSVLLAFTGPFGVILSLKRVLDVLWVLSGCMLGNVSSHVLSC